jgi:hypothetical protein
MLVLPSNATAQERTFATNLTNALETTNIAALVELHYCEFDEPWAAEWFFRQLVKHPCDQIRLERAESVQGAADLGGLEGGRANLPVGWLVVLRQPPLPLEAAGTNTTVLPAGQLNGQIVITRRMALFTPFQKQLVLAAGALATLLALWYLGSFIRLRRRDGEAIRYFPLGLAMLLVCFGAECGVVVFAMSHLVPHPLRLLALPLVGLFACVAAALYDERQKATRRQPSDGSSPLAALAKAWRAWKNREGPFASPRMRSTVLLAVALAAAWLGAYLWRGTSIALYSQHTQGTVVGSGRRQGVHYTYQVAGRQYSGSGVGSFERIYPVGSPVDVKYSAAHPAYSTIDNDPFLFLEQLAFGLTVMFGLTLLAGFKRRV